jgi:hypothetical protein
VSSPILLGLVLVLGEGVDAAGIAFESRKRALTLSREPARGQAAEG